jgi:bifunctional UDP-N-acetylglucosamine pyrophosphorylase/glucosamine-1-phosphate N-acetyltransferase
MRDSAKRPEGEPALSPIFVRQTEQLGTGHAVAMARDALKDFPGPIIIMAGDVPLISPNTLDGFLKAHQALKADLSVLTVEMDDPAAYGRIIRDEANWLESIVEFRDATDEQRQIREINSGLYLAEAGKLFESIERLSPNNDQKEYYLTDVVADFRARGLTAAAIEIPQSIAYEVQGINNRYELAEAQAILKDRINEAWMRAGVTMLGPLSTFVECGVRLAQDVTLWPSVILSGRSTVGQGAEIGPFCHLHDCRVEPGAKVPGHQSLSGTDFSNDTTEMNRPRP